MRRAVFGLVAGLVVGLGLVAGTGTASAASFDCAHARRADERAICADRTLNDKDVQLAQLYEIDLHLVAMGRRGVLQDEQVAWLRGRRGCGGGRQCLAAAYDHRLARLREVLDSVYRQGPF